MVLKRLAALLLLVAASMALLSYAGQRWRPEAPDSIVLHGEGSSFLYPQVQAWSEEVRSTYPWLVVNYNPTGSGAGQSAFIKRVVDFAGSDPPLTGEAWERLRGKVVQLPVVIGMVAVVYNVPGVDGLRLNAEVLALIYRGEIEYWDDDAIARLNPTANLPHERIIVVHRSDSSGTTQVFTLYLHKAAPSLWPQELVGKSPDWPVDYTGRGIGGKGNQGVTELVKRNPYSIGYVEYAYAVKEGLSIALLENREGEYVAPSPEAAQEAARNALGSLPDSPDGDWSRGFDSVIYAPGRGSYPLTTWSFLLFYKEYPGPEAEAVRAFIGWINTEGQKRVVEGYVPIPEELRSLNLKAVEMIGVAGG